VGHCVLRVLGDEFDAKRFLSTTKLIPSSVFCKGELRQGRLKPSETSGFTLDVGSGEFSEQVRLATDFLLRHGADLRRVSTTPGVESFFVDFFHVSRLDQGGVAVQCDVLPAAFIRLAGDVGLEVRLSLFRTASANSD
jgi:hypothetical protein